MIEPGLRFGPLTANAVHAAIDMQRLFAEGSEWATPATRSILPAIALVAAHAPERTIFTRFLAPDHGHELPGQWRTYYQRWASVLASRNPAELYGLLPELSGFAPPARVIDKYAHSAYETPAFQQALDEMGADALILTGVETDVCVLATALTAIDRGLRVLIVIDAVAGSNPAGHEAALAAIYPRFDQQVEYVDVATLLDEWRP